LPQLKPSLSIIDVGHGNCAVLEDGAQVVIIDAGPGSSVIEYLKREQITTIDIVLLSHSDSDHIAGLVALIGSGEFQIRCVRLNSDALKGSQLWEDLVYTLDKCHNAGTTDFDVSLTSRLGNLMNRGSVGVEVLGPSLYLAGIGPGGVTRAGRRLTSNSLSAVIRISYDKQPIILFPGDLDSTGLEDLLEHQLKCESSILVFPHHGGRAGSGSMTSFVERICKAVNPKTIVFSIGRGVHGTPQPEVIETIRKVLPGVHILCTQLSEHCAPKVPSAIGTHVSKKYARGHEHKRCCAGTIVITFGDSISLLPQPDEHHEFIKINAPTSLCQKTK